MAGQAFKGARMDVFCAAATGRIEIVKAFLADDPKVIDLKGPHGIPLIRHAQAGKQEAVIEFLKTREAKGQRSQGNVPPALSSSHLLQSSSAPSHFSRPSGVTTQGRSVQGGLWRTCCPCPHSRSATQSSRSSW